MEYHNVILEEIVLQVKEFFANKIPFSIYHGSTNSTRASTKSTSNTVDISRLDRVICVDYDRKVALVEPNVPMDALVTATLKRNLIPPVVMEFPGITAGGGFSGTSGESSSFTYGLFDRTVNWIEIVLGNGEILGASLEENKDLFIGAAAAFGTLGIVTLLELQLIEVPKDPVVKVTYFPFDNGVNEAINTIKRITPLRYNYLDGVLFSKEKGLICAGEITSSADEHNLETIRFTRATDPWFYMHVEKHLHKKEGDPTSEIIPLVDYLFRYDRGGFWVAKYVSEYFLLPQIPTVRWMLDYFAHTRVLYHGAHSSGLLSGYTIQDIAVPYGAVSELIDFIDAEFTRYPLWLCPVRQNIGRSSGLLACQLGTEGGKDVQPPDMLLNIGVWGPGPKGDAFFRFNRELEKLVHRLGGQKWLYARTYYTKAEFWQIYDQSGFDDLRKKYHASSLPDLYEKVRARPEEPQTAEALGVWRRILNTLLEQWPIGGLIGLLHCIWYTDYLLGDHHETRG